jgi:hypothetical protein
MIEFPIASKKVDDFPQKSFYFAMSLWKTFEDPASQG